MAKKYNTKNGDAPSPATAGTLPAAKADDGVLRFSIPGGDPFVDGAARAYKGDMIDPTHRPLVLRADDPAAPAALDAYALRAGGACDLARTKAANEAINAFAKIK
jgi:hypothetical protein